MNRAPGTLERYTTAARINHWITATCLVLLAVSGMALFHPSLFFLTSLLWRRQYAGRPSLVRRGAAGQFRAAVRPFRPPQSVGEGRHTLDARDAPRAGE